MPSLQPCQHSSIIPMYRIRFSLSLNPILTSTLCHGAARVPNSATQCQLWGIPITTLSKGRPLDPLFRRNQEKKKKKKRARRGLNFLIIPNLFQKIQESFCTLFWRANIYCKSELFNYVFYILAVISQGFECGDECAVKR